MHAGDRGVTDANKRIFQRYRCTQAWLLAIITRGKKKSRTCRNFLYCNILLRKYDDFSEVNSAIVTSS